MSRRSVAFRMRIGRYVQIIRLRYNIKREYFTVAIPMIVAITLLIAAALTGHTFVIQEESGTSAGSGEDAARLAAYQALVAEIGEDERVQVWKEM